MAEALARCPGIEVDLEGVQTNIVYFSLSGGDAVALQAHLDRLGVHLLSLGPSMMRAVVSLAVDEPAVDRAVEIIRDAVPLAITNA